MKTVVSSHSPTGQKISQKVDWCPGILNVSDIGFGISLDPSGTSWLVSMVIGHNERTTMVSVSASTPVKITLNLPGGSVTHTLVASQLSLPLTAAGTSPKK